MPVARCYYYNYYYNIHNKNYYYYHHQHYLHLLNLEDPLLLSRRYAYTSKLKP